MPPAGAIRAGRAFVELFADDSKLVRGLKRARARLKAFGAGIQNMGRRMVMASAAILAPIALATRVFADFDDQMRTVKAVTGATGKEFDRLTEKAKLLGRTTSFTAAQVAGMMVELGRAGFDPAQIDASAAAILNLARATGTELPLAAQIAASTLRVFGLSADEMSRVADVMTATANNSAQTLEDLAESMKHAGPVADAYGLSLEETNKTLGALANFSIKGSLAGTTFKNIMLKLADPSVRKRLEQLGVAVTDDAGEFRKVSAILRDLGKSIGNIPRPDQLALMEELFGKRAIAGGIKLTGAAFDKLNDSIDNANGTAKRTADEMDAGIGGVLRRLWSAVEGVAIAVGETLAGSLSKLGEWLTKTAGDITGWIKQNRELLVMLVKIVAIVGVVGAAFLTLSAMIGLVGFGITGVVAILGAIAFVFGVILAILGAILSPIGLVVAAVVAMGVAILHVTGAGGKALAWLGERFEALRVFAVESFRGIADALVAGDIVLAAKIMWLSLKEASMKGMNDLKQLWLKFRNFVLTLGHMVLTGWLGIFQTLWHGLKVGWRETIGFIEKLWHGTAGVAAKVWNAIAGTVTNVIADVWNALVYLVAKLPEFIREKTGLGGLEKMEKKDIGKAATDIEKETAAKKKIIDERLAEDRAKDAELFDKRMRGLLEKHEAFASDLDKKRIEKQIAGEKELADIAAERQAALDEAKRKREAVDKRRLEDAEPPEIKALEGLKDKLRGIMEGAGEGLRNIRDRTVDVRGTFNPAALLGLQAGGVDDRIASATERTVKEIKALRKDVKDNQAEFT